MGVGGSTDSRPGSATVLVKCRPPSDLPSRRESAHEVSTTQHNHTERPTGSCCSHYRKNHATITRTVTPASPSVPNDNIDDEIEEIVANTLDLVSSPKDGRTDTSAHEGRDFANRVPVDSASAKWDREEMRGSAVGSGVELRRTLRSTSRVVQKRPSDEISEDQDETQLDAKVSYVAWTC